ncbi:phenylalanine--tRNA ligase subunit beta, partial [bacterium]|nr:phenylalanine--tRNA ligase subunit beta [bacterium]
GALIRGIKVGESPAWLREKLHLLGLRSINNIVDLTNYLMMEYGHPMHAFDADLLRGSEIRVRSAKPGEELVTLDGVTRKLSDEDLLICDGAGPVALAGVMGGENSEIKDQTSNLFLEIAYFDPIRIRKTSRKLKLHTDASHRFERGMDPELPLVLTGITIQYILDLAGGEFIGISDAYPKPWKANKIVFNPGLIKRILGIELSDPRMEEILVKLGCEVQMDSQEPWSVFPPSFRPDLERPIDLVEEICRIHGMNEVPFEAPKVSLEFRRDRHIKTSTEKLQDLLVGAGLQECVTYSFSDQDPPGSVKVLNPISDKMGQLRSTISEKLLDSALYNYKQQNEKIGLFEVGTTFSESSSGEGDKPYREETRLSVLLCNQQEVNWKNQSRQSDIFDLKGVLDKIAVLFDSKFRLRPASELPPFLDQENSLDILFRNQRAGFMGAVDPSMLAKEKIHDAMVVLELCLDEVFLCGRKEPVFKQLPQIPGARKQLALITPSTLPCEEVLRAIGSLKIQTLESFDVFDLYTGKGISEGHKSLGINFMFRGKEKTLSEEEMTSSVDKILEALHKKYSIVLRP